MTSSPLPMQILLIVGLMLVVLVLAPNYFFYTFRNEFLIMCYLRTLWIVYSRNLTEFEFCPNLLFNHWLNHWSFGGVLVCLIKWPQLLRKAYFNHSYNNFRVLSHNRIEMKYGLKMGWLCKSSVSLALIEFGGLYWPFMERKIMIAFLQCSEQYCFVRLKILYLWMFIYRQTVFCCCCRELFIG